MAQRLGPVRANERLAVGTAAVAGVRPERAVVSAEPPANGIALTASPADPMHLGLKTHLHVGDEGKAALSPRPVPARFRCRSWSRAAAPGARTAATTDCRR